MNRRINRRYQTPLRPDFAHFLIEEQGLSDKQKKSCIPAKKQNANTTQMAMMNGFNNVNSSLCQGFGGVQESINNLSHQMEQCCCNLKTQMMQDKYDALKTQYDQSLQAISNSVQTHNILSQLGRYYTNPPYYPQYGTYYPTGATVA